MTRFYTGSARSEIPARGVNARYMHFLEAEIRRTNRHAAVWCAVAVMSTLSILAITYLTNWWAG